MGRTRLTAKSVSPADHERFEVLAREHGCLFDTIGWMSQFGQSIRRYGLYDRNDSLRGGFHVFESSFFGVRIFRNPPFTPSAGPFFEYRSTNAASKTGEIRAVIDAMATALDRRRPTIVSLGLSLGVSDCLPFYWRDFKVIPHYTFRIQLQQDIETLRAAMSAERRNDITKAKRDKITTEITRDMSTASGLIKGVFERKNCVVPVDLMETILHRDGIDGQDGVCVVAKRDGLPVSAVFIVHDSRTAYYLMGGSAGDKHHGAGALAMFEAIKIAKNRGLEYFDFEGSVIPSVERYFRGFGGALTPFFRVYKAWFPIEIVLKARYRNRY